MQFSEAIIRADEIIKLSTDKKHTLDPTHFGEYAELAAYAARQLTPAQREALPWIIDWAKTWRHLYDDFEKHRKADPMMIYQPMNPTADAFHRSNAYIRYFRAGNRTSKTTAGYAEHYFSATGFHPYREQKKGQASTFLVCGLPFVDYAPKVFEKKMLIGEDGNILSPMFPEGGKWFYHYHKPNHVLTIACSECAEKGKAGSCPGHHKKATIALVSSEKGPGVIEAFSARLAHGDEHIPEEFLSAMQMRVADQGGFLIFTGTPLHGPEAWEARKLSTVAEMPAAQNRRYAERADSPPFVSLHQCSQFEGGIVDEKEIKASMQGMDSFEIESRIYGRPSALAKNPVFDRNMLAEMRNKATTPSRHRLQAPRRLQECDDNTTMDLQADTTGALRVWEKPVHKGQYVIGCDTAAGLAKGDASCATVMKLVPTGLGISLEMVAQYHGWLGIFEYADEIFKLACYYNSGLVIIELTGGLGRGVLERLKGGKSGDGLSYWNIFRDTVGGEYAQFGQNNRFGVESTGYSKASMIGSLQHYIKNNLIKIPCRDTIAELTAYEQDRTEAGNTRYRGASGSHDDRVMSLVIATSVAATFPVYDYGQDMARQTELINAHYTGDWKKIHKELNEMRSEARYDD